MQQKCNALEHTKYFFLFLINYKQYFSISIWKIQTGISFINNHPDPMTEEVFYPISIQQSSNLVLRTCNENDQCKFNPTNLFDNVVTVMHSRHVSPGDKSWGVCDRSCRKQSETTSVRLWYSNFPCPIVDCHHRAWREPRTNLFTTKSKPVTWGNEIGKIQSNLRPCGGGENCIQKTKKKLRQKIETRK